MEAFFDLGEVLGDLPGAQVKRNEIGFRKCLEESGIKLRWEMEKKESYLESCKYYLDFYEKLYSEYLPKDKNADILEIGCGFGWFLYYLDKKNYKNITGIDFDFHKLDIVKRFGIKKVEKADAFDFLRNKKKPYDLIILTCVLEHISRDKLHDFLTLIYKNLKKGGKIVVTVPNMEFPLNLRMRYIDFTHQSGFTVNSLLHVLYYANFNNLRLKEQFVLPEGKVKRKRYEESVKFVKELYNGLCIRPPLFYAEHFICSATK